MSEFSPKHPLSVLLFHYAMQQQITITELARRIEINSLTMNNYIKGKTSNPRRPTVNKLSEVLNLTAEEIEARADLRPLDVGRFDRWLQLQQRGRSRASLVKGANISDSTVRNYLDNTTLPDADQAARIATFFNVPYIDLAALIIASHAHRENMPLAPLTFAAPPAPPAAPPTPVIIEASSAAPVSEEEVAAPSTESTKAAKLEEDPSAPLLLSLDEQRMLDLWRRLHPQGRRATLGYIAELLAAG